MNFDMRFLLELDQKARILVRFVFETFLVSVIYLIWVMKLSDFAELGLDMHFLNLTIWCVLYKMFGLNRDRLRFSSLNSYYPILRISFFLTAILVAEGFAQSLRIEFASFALYFLVTLNSLVGLRVLVRQTIRRSMLQAQENVLVYGTSDIAIDFANAIAFGKKYKVIGFISETSQKFGSLAGFPVVLFENLESYARLHNCRLVVIAEQTVNLEHRAKILRELDKLNLSVSYAPTIDRAFDYEVQLKAVTPEEVLGCVHEITFDGALSSQISGKTILVTGGGGSIGSEICRQILRYNPETLIVLDSNEFAIYNLGQELSESFNTSISNAQVIFRLGSVTDKSTLSAIFEQFSIDLVYHAAAYKHVPIVEENISAGITNNVFGTKLLADFAHRYEVSKFVLISSDKAVRPTNVMGATKRLSELVIQDLAKTSATIFTMVRFGNVLGSSGSVIPKFKSQINEGGPITVTHEEITRYFMSIPQAVHLVLNSGILAKGGEVFIIDMGDPVKIVDLAISMVRQHGLQPVLQKELEGRQKHDNEICIEFTGLRAGEKLYEELLIDGTVEKTADPRIFVSRDGLIDDLEISVVLQLLERLVKENKYNELLEQLQKLPLSFTPVSCTSSVKPDGALSAEQNQRADKVALETGEDIPKRVNRDHHSIVHKIVKSKIGLSLLHRYFLFTRAMTLGVRVLVINQKQEVLLVKHTYLPGWHLPGGGVDHDEDVITAARREVFEETGISDLTRLEFLELNLNKPVSRRDHVAYFKARTSESITAKQSLEISEHRFVSFNEAVDIIEPDYLNFIRTHSCEKF